MDLKKDLELGRGGHIMHSILLIQLLHFTLLFYALLMYTSGYMQDHTKEY